MLGHCQWCEYPHLGTSLDYQARGEPTKRPGVPRKSRRSLALTNLHLHTLVFTIPFLFLTKNADPPSAAALEQFDLDRHGLRQLRRACCAAMPRSHSRYKFRWTKKKITRSETIESARLTYQIANYRPFIAVCQPFVAQHAKQMNIL